VTRGDERGSAVVEFALVTPLLLLVALALVQIAVIGRDRLVLEHAVRAGVRQASIDPDDAAVRQAVDDAVAPLDPVGVAVQIDRGGTFGDPVVVRVDYDVPVAVPLAGWLLPASVHLATELAMRQEFG
jgi:Flp pilus assembly protein TadG